MTKAPIAILAAFAALFLAIAPASSQTRERIVAFDSEIWINADASLTVRETIAVDSARQKIKRGIYRDFPTVYRDRTGQRSTVGFELQEITRDGRREPYHTERQSNGIRVYIGDADVFIPAGRHVYTIAYRTDRQLGFFDGYDELYWNVTGNGWEFPIERARATVHLPAGAYVVDHAGYTGPTGARGGDYRYTAPMDRTATFETTRALAPREGLTIALSWPPGLVARPSGEDRVRYFLNDNLATAAGIGGLALLLAYYLIVWARVGRDPAAGPLVPQYEPPTGISPAGARYISQMGFDDKVFTAAIVSLAVKGALTIEEDESKAFSLRRTATSPALSKGEAALIGKLFPGAKKQIELKQSNHKTLQAAQAAMRQALRTEFEKTYFVRNTRYFTPGIVLTVLALLALVATAPEPEGAGFISVWLAIWSVGVYFLFRRTWRGWQAALAGDGSVAYGQAVGMTLFALPFCAGELFGLSFYAETTSVAATVMLVLILLSSLLFYHLLKAPTRLGRRVMDALDGFKEYLSVAEQDRMNLLNPPERTPELFEKYLPYALALGVEQQWAEQFSDVLARAAATGTAHGSAYSPRWYSGRGFDRGSRDFTSALSGSLSGAIAAASTAPGSSSGSGGGGSSGGGGGGGGGGGW